MGKNKSAHWGWYWKIKLNHTPKALCTEAFRIDIFEIARNMSLSTQRLQRLRVDVEGNIHEVGVFGEAIEAIHGGFRYYFVAPCCGKHLRFIYFLEKLGCRQCLHLGYQSQRLRPSRRFESMRKKVESALEERGGSTSKRPRWMHRTTWEAFKKRIFNYEKLFVAALYKELLQYYPSLRNHRLGALI